MVYKYGDWITGGGTYYGKARMYYEYNFGTPDKANNTVSITVSGRAETVIVNQSTSSDCAQYRCYIGTPQLTVAGSIYNGSGKTVTATGTKYNSISGISSKSKTIAYATVTGTGTVTVKITSGVDIESRVSSDGGSTWTSWVNRSSGTSTVTATISLPTNNRQSVISSFTGSGTVEGSYANSFTQYVTGATHRLDLYAYYNSSWYGTHTVNPFTSGNSLQFTETELSDIYTNVPITNATIYTRLTTYLNGTSLGESCANLTEAIVDTIAGTLTYADTNSTTVALTADNQKIVQNQSILSVILGTATVDKSATISSYAIYVNNVLKSTQTAGGTYSLGVQDLSTNGELKLIITDSRSQTKTYTATLQVIAWSAPTGTIDLQRVNNFESTATLKVSANYASSISGNVLALSYKYKLASATAYTTGTTALTNATLATLAETFNSAGTYDFQIIVADSLDSTTYQAVLPKGVPLLYLDAMKNSVGVGDLPTNSDVFSLAKSLELVGTTTLVKTVDELIALMGSETRQITYDTLPSGVTVTSLYAIIAGKVVSIYGKVSNSNSIAARSIIFNFDMTNVSDILPSIQASAQVIYRGADVNMVVGSTGNLVAYNRYTSASNFANGIEFCITYVIA